MPIKQKRFSYLVILLLAAGLLLAAAIFRPSVEPASARSASSLQSEINKIENEIEQKEAVIHELEHQAATLQTKIAQYEAQISTTQNKIDATNLKIEKLNVEIKAATKELEYQKDVLAQNIRELYKQGDVTTIEMLASSGSYSEFINQQEYLERIKSAVQESAAKVEELKNQLEADHKEQKNLKTELLSQRQELDSQRAGQQQLLVETQGQEAKYQSIVKDLREKQRQAEAALIAALSSGSFKAAPIGPVSAGDVVGSVGNSGFSTGDHLHLEVRLGGGVTNPSPYIKHQPVNPVYVTQGYWAANPVYYSGHHPGIDYAPGGGAIYAIDSGFLYRGCSNDVLKTINNDYGYVAIVDHGGGRTSVYAHMSGGPAACNYNTYW